MTNSKLTKRALLTSVMALFLCVAMLTGTTFAWFTDTVTSSGNKIVAGNLDVQLLMNTGSGYADISDSTDPIFGAGSIAQNNNAETLWEPGKTQIAYLGIRNAGNLALKYNVIVDVTDNELVGALEYAIIPLADENATVSGANWNEIKANAGASYGDLAAGRFIAAPNGCLDEIINGVDNETDYFALAIHMKEEADNKFMSKSVTIDITVAATQVTAESDSINDQYDNNSEYPVSITLSAPVTLDGANKTESAVSLTFNDASSAISDVKVDVPEGTQLEAGATQLVFKIKQADKVNADVATQITSEQTATTYEISLDGVAANNDKDIDVTLFIEKGLVDVKLYHKDVEIYCDYNGDTGELSFSTKGFSPFTVVSTVTELFEEGEGTAESPYIIKTAEDLLNISKYNEYKYYKVADGVETLDLNGIGNLSLYGSFDGNGVKIVNLSTALFQNVGRIDEAKEIKISNMDVTVHTTNGRALVRNIFNPGETIFENISMHGYIEGQYNMGSFYNYGTANHGSSEGVDYTVSFVNAKSDVTLVCTTGNVMGGMLGHGYEGANYKLYVNMDKDSGYTGKMYTTTGVNCYQVMAMCSHATYVLNGEEISRYTNTYPSTKLNVVAPVAGENGYTVTPVEGVDHFVVFLNAQITAYDENGNKIANLAGMTRNLGNTTVTEGLDGKIFDLISSAKIVNGLDHKSGYEMADGALTVYTGSSENYASGWITLQVNQYSAEGKLLATGILTIHTFEEPNA